MYTIKALRGVGHQLRYEQRSYVERETHFVSDGALACRRSLTNRTERLKAHITQLCITTAHAHSHTLTQDTNSEVIRGP